VDDIVFGGFTELIVNKDENVKILVHPRGSSPGADDVRTPGSTREGPTRASGVDQVTVRP